MSTARFLAAAIGRDATAWYTRHRTGLQHAPTPVVAAVAAGALFAVALVLFTAWQIATGLVDAAVDALRTTADTGLARTVTDPVEHYLRGIDGLPASGEALFTTWVAATITLFLLAITGSRGARVGWSVMGALTVAMAYVATPGPTGTRLVVAGLATTFWALASVPAFAHTRRRDPERIVVPAPPRPARPADTRADTRADADTLTASRF